MISLSQLRKLLAALVLAGMAVFMLPACSSSDDGSTSGSDVNCDLNPSAPGCVEELQDKVQ
jgi:hypothetical protein